ncbi:MAG: ParB family transcriptional regulator, chromosome partitioning protein [Thermoplasmata archaeon]|jgi:hypothetical protein|nr:ParB family transcriptional regulator, chromosome partitioning protein [Thermoplasmata archaeon]
MQKTKTKAPHVGGAQEPVKGKKRPSRAQVRAANMADAAQADLGAFDPSLVRIRPSERPTMLVPLAKLKHDPKKPREIDEAWAHELADMIRLAGQRTALDVRPDPDNPGQFFITDGHHRHAALMILQKTDPEQYATALCYATEQTEAMAAAGSLVQNVGVKAHNSYEQGRALSRLREATPGISIKTLARLAGHSESWVEQRLRIHALGPTYGPYAAEHCSQEGALRSLEAFVQAKGVENETLATQVKEAVAEVLRGAAPERRDWHSIRWDTIHRLESLGWREDVPWDIRNRRALVAAFEAAPSLADPAYRPIRYFPQPELEKAVQAAIEQEQAEKAKARSKKSTKTEEQRQKDDQRRFNNELHRRTQEQALIALTKGAARSSPSVVDELGLRVLCRVAEYDEGEADRIATSVELPYPAVMAWGNKTSAYPIAKKGMTYEERLKYVKGLKGEKRSHFVAAVLATYMRGYEGTLELVARTSIKEISTSAEKQMRKELKEHGSGKVRRTRWWEDPRRVACPVCLVKVKAACRSRPKGALIAGYHDERVRAAAKVPIRAPPKQPRKVAPAPASAVPAPTPAAGVA